jgi:membrane protease YdiL (CAAX protease family)
LRRQRRRINASWSIALSQAEQRTPRSGRHLVEALVAFALFCSLTLLSCYAPLALHLTALAGLVFPLVWGKVTGRWADMGFTRQGLPTAVSWGVGTGLISCLIGSLTVPEDSLVPDLGLQLAVGVPGWLLLASPFQEFLFRGWLQPRYERALGRRWGLLVATIGFTGWHYLLPIFGASTQSSFPLHSLKGLAATFAAGLVYGYGFQRTGHIVTPWLAHALAGIMFVALGSGSFMP